MGNTKYNYLHFERFRNLVNWSVSHLLGMNMGFTHRFPMVTIGSVIERSKTTIDIDDSTQYKQITLKTNGGGAVLRDVKLGKDIGTKKQYIVSAEQFIMSKIDARNGAFGVVTEDLDGAVVTADFPVFNVVVKSVGPAFVVMHYDMLAYLRPLVIIIRRQKKFTLSYRMAVAYTQSEKRLHPGINNRFNNLVAFRKAVCAFVVSVL